MKLHDLREQLAAKTREWRGIEDAAKGAALSDEATKRVATLRTECRALVERIRSEEEIADMERRATATPINGNVRDDFDRECRAPGLFLDAIAASGNIEGRDTGRVREISAELSRRMGIMPKGILIPTSVFEQRVVVSSTTGAGAIGTDHRGDLTIDALRAATITDRLGATVLSNLQGNVSIPAVDTGFTSAWIAENGALSAADWDINARTLTPKHVGALTEFSLNMIKQADPSVNDLAARDGARALAAALDSAALVGGGSNEPSGIIDRLIDAGELGTWATPTWEQGLKLIADVEAANVVGARLGWALHPTVVKKLRATVRVSSTDSRFIMETPNDLYGYTALASGHAAMIGSPSGGSAIFGAWENLVVGYWGGVDILANPYESTAFTKGGVQVRALLTADVAVRSVEAFRAAADMATA